MIRTGSTADAALGGSCRHAMPDGARCPWRAFAPDSAACPRTTSASAGRFGSCSAPSWHSGCSRPNPRRPRPRRRRPSASAINPPPTGPSPSWSRPSRGSGPRKVSTPSCRPFPPGRPRSMPGAQEAWDVGGMGSAPAVLGASRYGLLIIGITNDESMANAVMVRGDAAATWLKRPARDLRRKTVPLRHAGAPGEDLSHRRVHEAGSGARQVAPLGDQLSITLRIARKPASGDRRGVSSSAWALPIRSPAWSGRGAF